MRPSRSGGASFGTACRHAISKFYCACPHAYGPTWEVRRYNFSKLAHPCGVAGAAARVETSKHLNPLQRRVDALVECQGETN